MQKLRRSFSAVCALLLVALTLISPQFNVRDLGVAQAATAPPKGDHVMIGVLPDTQFHSRYATEENGDPYKTRFGSEPYDEQTKWLVESTKEYGTEFVMGLGDIVDQWDRPQQWDVADRAVKNLEDAKLPYSIPAGNHDVGNDFAEYQQTFPVERQAKQSTWAGSDPTGLHTANLIDHNGQKFLVIAFSWEPDDAAFAWANQVIADNPGVPTIVTAHQILGLTEDGQGPESNEQGERIWDNVVKNNDQVFLTYSGHHHGAMTRTRENAAGNPVLQVLIDHQGAYMGGNGILAMLDLDLTNNMISQTTLSPWVAKKPKDTLRSLDVAYLTGQYETFERPFNFKERFPNLKVSSDVVDNPTTKLREWAASIEVPGPDTLEEAQKDEYTKVDGTLAHWRIDGEGVAKVGSTITDVAGGNDFTRAPLNIDGVEGAQEGDVTFSTDHSPYSSNFGSVCFANANKNLHRSSYFKTAADAPLNNEEFTNGFTFETFVKISPSFRVEDNQWMAWLGRDGRRGNLTGYEERGGSESDEPPLAWAFSNLHQVQFSFADATDMHNDPSLWSAELVDYTDWVHLVVTNDPKTRLSTLYVNGIPMLSDGPNTLGISSDNGLPWILGSGTYAGVRDSGFVGCVGETRIVDHVLDRDEWLTARAAAPEEPGTEEPGTETPEAEEPSTEPSGEGTEEPATEESTQPAPEGDDETPVSQTSAPESTNPATNPRDPGSTGSDNAGDTGTGDGQADGGTRALPRTGVSVGISLAVAVTLLAAGTGVMIAARRKR